MRRRDWTVSWAENVLKMEYKRFFVASQLLIFTSKHENKSLSSFYTPPYTTWDDNTRWNNFGIEMRINYELLPLLVCKMRLKWVCLLIKKEMKTYRKTIESSFSRNIILILNRFIIMNFAKITFCAEIFYSK